MASPTEIHPAQDSALLTTNKATFSENSAHSNHCGPPHHRGGHRHPRRGGRTHRGSHPSSVNAAGQWQHHSRPNSSFSFRPNRLPTGPPSFPPYSPTGWPSWAGSHWAQPAPSFPTAPWAPPTSSNGLSAGLLGPRLA